MKKINEGDDVYHLAIPSLQIRKIFIEQVMNGFSDILAEIPEEQVGMPPVHSETT